jgi:hypothetical protein
VRDWRIVDSETVVLDKRRLEEYPSTGDHAALKVRKTLSVGTGITVDDHLSPAREHDSPHLTLDERWRGMGLLVDLGSASIARLPSRRSMPSVVRPFARWSTRRGSPRCSSAPSCTRTTM